MGPSEEQRKKIGSMVSCSDVAMSQQTRTETNPSTEKSSSTGDSKIPPRYRIHPSMTPMTVVTKDSFSDFSVSECCKYVIFLFIFTFLIIVGRGENVENYFVTKSIESILQSNEFEKTQISKAPASFEDVMTINDIYDYMEFVFIPNMLTGTEIYSDGAWMDEKDRNFVVQQNKLLGGFRILQIRGEEAECQHPDSRYRCFVEIVDNKGDVDTSEWKGVPYQSGDALHENANYHGVLGTYKDGGHVVDFSMDSTESLEELHRLQTIGFFDSATRVIYIDFNTYNANLNLHSVARLSLELPASGGVESKIEIKTWKFNRYAGNTGNSLVALEVLTLLCILVFTMEEFYEYHDKGMEEYIADRWNILDWINLLVFYITIGWRIHQYALIKDAKSSMYNVTEYGSLRDLQFSFQWENYIQMINGFLLWMKLFKYMTFSHRVRFLFTMLQRSSKDLLIFTFVLGVFYCAFGMVAFLCFSSDVSDFRNFQYSFFNLVRFTVTEMDYEAVSNSNRYIGNMFYFIWSMLMVMILANVFIAILSEAYATISDEDDDHMLLDRLRASFAERMSSIKDHAIAGAMRHFGWNTKSANDIIGETDRNQDGRLSTQEVADALGVNAQKAAQIVHQFDANNDQNLDLKELNHLQMKLAANKQEVESELVDEEKTKRRRKESIHQMNQKLDRLETLLKQLAEAQITAEQKK